MGVVERGGVVIGGVNDGVDIGDDNGARDDGGEQDAELGPTSKHAPESPSERKQSLDQSLDWLISGINILSYQRLLELSGEHKDILPRKSCRLLQIGQRYFTINCLLILYLYLISQTIHVIVFININSI